MPAEARRTGQARTHEMTSVWPCRMCAGIAASLSQTMMCLSFEPDTTEPSAATPTVPT
jgi:hypothetical protein